jgi:tRNA threonylcarbamoyladenosine biosynthesis protein TsaE
MPVLTPSSIEYISRSTEQTRRVGVRLGTLLQPGDTICLEGDLGSGKTTLVQGISAGWGSLDLASSPTFVLVNVYRRPDEQRLFHLDAYRLNHPDEAEELDLDAMLGQGPLVIEWADRIREALPLEYLWIRLRWVEIEQRDLLISARGERYQHLLHNFRRQVYGVG